MASFQKLSYLTECPICAGTLSHPKVLPCIHTFCLNCTEQYGKEKQPGDKMPCPMCRTEFTIPDGGYSSLPTNLFINKFLDAQKATENKEIKSYDACLFFADTEKKPFCDNIYEIAECSICTGILSHPKVPPYIYTYGRGKQLGDELPFSMCRTEFAVPDGEYSCLPTNYFIERLLDVRKATENKEKKSCNVFLFASRDRMSTKETPASMFCVDCPEDMCEQCSSFHQNTKMSRTHLILPLETNVREFLNVTKTTCQRHYGDESKMYCMDCEEVLCLQCFMQDHQMHKCRDFRVVVEEMKNGIKKDIADVDKCLLGIEEQSEVLVNELKRFTESVAQTESEIVRKGEKIKQIVEMGVQTILQKLNCEKTRKLKEIKNVKEEFKKKKIMIESFKRYSFEIMDKAFPSDVARVAKDLNKRANEIKNQPRIEIGKQENVCLFLADLNLCISSIKNIFGNISGFKEFNKEREEEEKVDVSEQIFDIIKRYNSKFEKAVVSSCSIGENDVSISLFSSACKKISYNEHAKNLRKIILKMGSGTKDVEVKMLSGKPLYRKTCNPFPGEKIFFGTNEQPLNATLGLYLDNNSQKKPEYALLTGHNTEISDRIWSNRSLGEIVYVVQEGNQEAGIQFCDAALAKLEENDLSHENKVRNGETFIHLFHTPGNVADNEVQGVRLFKNDDVLQRNRIKLEIASFWDENNETLENLYKCVKISTSNRKALHNEGESGLLVTTLEDPFHVVSGLVVLTGIITDPDQEEYSIGQPLNSTIERFKRNPNSK